MSLAGQAYSPARDVVARVEGGFRSLRRSGSLTVTDLSGRVTGGREASDHDGFNGLAEPVEGVSVFLYVCVRRFTSGPRGCDLEAFLHDRRDKG